MKQSKFIAQTYIPAALVRAASLQVGGWKELCAIAQDVVDNGRRQGWQGFIYSKDTVPFFYKNRAAILQVLKHHAVLSGCSSELMLVYAWDELDASQGDIAFALYAGKLKQLFDSPFVASAVARYVLEKVCEEVSMFASWGK